ncbi:MAG TPA: hypothetical protein VN238_23010 [Solirubrobacteraceae bacterium]|nr:hypothetical protein [Solirubrobacteraceae bacterium]
MTPEPRAARVWLWLAVGWVLLGAWRLADAGDDTFQLVFGVFAVAMGGATGWLWWRSQPRR